MRWSVCPQTTHDVVAKACGRRGFTLLEMVVALLIFAAAGMALYGLLNTNLITLTRVQDVLRQAPAVREAMERLATVNPQQQDEGGFEVDDFEVAWTARLVEPMRQGKRPLAYPGPFNVGLYEIEFELRREGRAMGTWRMRQVGYDDVRERAPGAGTLGGAAAVTIPCSRALLVARTPAKGISLLETLVVLTLLSLLSVLMLQGLGAFVGRYDTVQRVHRGASFAVLQQHWFVTSVRGLVPVGVFARRFQGDASSFQGTTFAAVGSRIRHADSCAMAHRGCRPPSRDGRRRRR